MLILNIFKFLRFDKMVFLLFSYEGFGLQRYRSIRIIFEFFASRLRSNFIEIGGHKMFLDSRDSLCLSINGVYEPLETEIIKKEVKSGDIVLDIGAHIGYYTLILAKIVGENGKVFAFEADPTNFNLLKKNIITNGYKNVILIHNAVSNENKKIKLYLCEYNNGMHRIYKSKFCSSYIEIESTRLDDYFEKINFNKQINFVKMDVEGAELDVLRGMSLLLDKNKKLKIVTEFAPVSLFERGNNPEDFIKILNKHDFQFFDINEKKNKINFIDIAKLNQKYTPAKNNYTNLLCLKKSK